MRATDARPVLPAVLLLAACGSEITPLPGSSTSSGYATLIPAAAVPSYLGRAQLASGHCHTATPSTGLIFLRTEPSVRTLGAHRARSSFSYTTPHMIGAAMVTYQVDCLATAY